LRDAVNLLDKDRISGREAVDKLLAWAEEEAEATRKWLEDDEKRKARLEAYEEASGLKQLREKYGSPAIKLLREA